MMSFFVCVYPCGPFFQTRLDGSRGVPFAAVDRATLNTTAIARVLGKEGLPKQSVFMFSTESADDGATAYGRKLGLDGRLELLESTPGDPLQLLESLRSPGCTATHKRN